jgi:hypothetical protein
VNGTDLHLPFHRAIRRDDGELAGGIIRSENASSGAGLFGDEMWGESERKAEGKEQWFGHARNRDEEQRQWNSEIVRCRNGLSPARPSEWN